MLWDLEILAPHVRLPWLIEGGPALPMEFSRVSAKRKLGLVVVLDPVNGVPCPTHAVASVRDSIAVAAEDLRARERAQSIAQIGAVCLETGLARSRHTQTASRVRTWCEQIGARGAVWTDLEANFRAHAGSTFSLDSARAYLRSLRADSLVEAVRYIDNAPAQTDTPLRRSLANDPWWQSLPRGNH